jgi:hypothetical protein
MVKTMKKKHADQIEVVGIDWNQDSIFHQMRVALENKDTAPIGWIRNTQLVPKGEDNHNYWLVPMRGQLYWMYAPAKDGTLWMEFFPVEQLFLD